MSMFDTFHIQARGRHLAAKTAQLARILDEYHIGNFIGFEQAISSRGIFFLLLTNLAFSPALGRGLFTPNSAISP